MPRSASAPQADLVELEAAKDMVAVMVIEDNRLLREGIAAMLNREPDFQVVAAAATVAVALDAYDTSRTAVLLLDCGLVDEDSLNVCARLSTATPALRIIIMGMAAAQEDISAFVRAGACGFLMKDATLEEFTETIRRAAKGEQSLPRALTHSLFSQIIREEVISNRAVLEEGVRLTSREQQIIGLLGEGLSNKDIALRLNIAVHTVKSHVHNVLEKLSLQTRLEVAVFSHTSGVGR